jgi:septal ring factor EnvC (AmiA/AmiB activator)
MNTLNNDKNQQLIKGYQNQINKLLADIAIDKSQISFLSKKINNSKKTISDLKKNIAEIQSNNDLVVIDHAIVRYLERVEGLDIESIKEKIKNEKIVRIYETLGGNGKYPCDDFVAVVRNNTIVTINPLD